MEPSDSSFIFYRPITFYRNCDPTGEKRSVIRYTLGSFGSSSKDRTSYARPAIFFWTSSTTSDKCTLMGRRLRHAKSYTWSPHDRCTVQHPESVRPSRARRNNCEMNPLRGTSSRWSNHTSLITHFRSDLGKLSPGLIRRFSALQPFLFGFFQRTSLATQKSRRISNLVTLHSSTPVTLSRKYLPPPTPSHYTSLVVRVL